MATAKKKSASILVRGLAPEVKRKLRVRAAEHGRSLEAEARAVLADAVGAGEPKEHLFDWMHRHFAKYGGIELEIPPRAAWRPPPNFDPDE